MLQPVAHVAEAVGLQREHRIEVVRRDDADRFAAAQFPGIASDLVGAVREHAHELQIGMRDDAAECERARVAGAAVEHPVRHSGALPAGTCTAG